MFTIILIIILQVIVLGPLVTESIVRTLLGDRIMETPRAWLEARLGDSSKLLYLTRCFRCLSHWVAGILGLVVGVLLGLPWQATIVVLLLVPATVSIAEYIHEKK